MIGHCRHTPKPQYSRFFFTLLGQAVTPGCVIGERNRYKLADLADSQIHVNREQIARSLEGNWRKELSFILQQERDLYQIYQL